MSGIHIVTLRAALLPIAFQSRTAAAPSQTQRAGSTTPEIAGQSKRVAHTAVVAVCGFFDSV
jgi:hypothetical protein